MAEPKKTPAPVGHNMVTYPAEALPHSAMHFVNHFRGVDTLTLPELGEHAATVLGCASSMAKGKQPVGASESKQPHGDPASLSNEELADIIESECQKVLAPQSAGAAPAALPAWMIAFAVQAAVRILQELFGFKAA